MSASCEDEAVPPSSPLLLLPAEIRLQIYSYLLPKEYLLVNLCPAQPTAKPVYGRSIVGGLLKQHTEFTNTVRSSGLHLSVVCKAIRNDILPVLRSIIARFHCDKCYAYFLKSMSRGTGIGLRWLQHVQIEVQIDTIDPFYREPLIMQARIQAKEMAEKLKKVTWSFYGRLDLMEREEWSIQRMRMETNQVAGLGSGHPNNSTTLPMLHNVTEQSELWLIDGVFDTISPRPD